MAPRSIVPAPLAGSRPWPTSLERGGHPGVGNAPARMEDKLALGDAGALSPQKLLTTVISQPEKARLVGLSPVNSVGACVRPSRVDATEQGWRRRFDKEWETRVDGYILANITSDPRTLGRLHSLKCRIGGEWAKDNNVRRIDTDMLKDWVQRLKHAVDKAALDLVLREIELKVDALLAVRLA